MVVSELRCKFTTIELPFHQVSDMPDRANTHGGEANRDTGFLLWPARGWSNRQESQEWKLIQNLNQHHKLLLNRLNLQIYAQLCDRSILSTVTDSEISIYHLLLNLIFKEEWSLNWWGVLKTIWFLKAQRLYWILCIYSIYSMSSTS